VGGTGWGRPTTISKCGIGATVLFPDLPANRSHRTPCDLVELPRGRYQALGSPLRLAPRGRRRCNYPDEVPRRRRPTDDGLAAWRGFLRVHQALVAELDRDLVERHDLPLAWYDVLVQLHEAATELTMGDLAGRLLISPSTCTRVVERMVAADLVERRIDADDARIRHVRLTAAGRCRLRAAAVTHLDGIERRFAGVLGADAARLAAHFETMLESIRR